MALKLEPLKLSRAEICRLSGESLSVVEDAIKAGHLKTFLVGRRRFARPEQVREWVDLLEAESDAGRPVCYRRRAVGVHREHLEV
jgi:hypothetical protein